MNKYTSLIKHLIPQTIRLIEREYPNGIRLSLASPENRVITPKKIYPAFYGCYDWHSAVHSHWQIVRAIRQLPEADFVSEAITVLGHHLTAENIATEMEWIETRRSFEMPYGMAWLLTLCQELAEWGTPEAQAWHNALRPMEQHAIGRFIDYCQHMARPIRGGMHNQSAFSLGLVWDYAVSQQNDRLQALIKQAGLRFFAEDIAAPLAYEPSAADFLSPALAEADLMGRLLTSKEFVHWLTQFAPKGFDQLRPVTVVDPSDGQLAHWAGLNLSRSWMLINIANRLPQNHDWKEKLQRNAADHMMVGLPLSSHPDYMISHWVPTFAIYLVTQT